MALFLRQPYVFDDSERLGRGPSTPRVADTETEEVRLRHLIRTILTGNPLCKEGKRTHKKT